MRFEEDVTYLTKEQEDELNELGKDHYDMLYALMDEMAGRGFYRGANLGYDRGYLEGYEACEKKDKVRRKAEKEEMQKGLLIAGLGIGLVGGIIYNAAPVVRDKVVNTYRKHKNNKKKEEKES